MPEHLVPEEGPGTASNVASGNFLDGDNWEQLTFFEEEEAQPHPRYAAADLSSGASRSSLRILDLYEDDRPRQRLATYGPRALSTAELLSILLGTGHHSTGFSAIDLAQFILQELGQSGDGALRQLQQLSMEELLAMPGVGPAKAATVIAAVELGKRVFNQSPKNRVCVDDPNVAVSLLSHDLMWEKEERFAVLMLNIRHQFLAKRLITIGTQTETLAHPRDIFGEALRCRAVRIIVAHNHPSGVLDPSPDDLALTRQLLQGGRVLGLPVLDHLILGDGKFQSLRQTTSLWQEYPQETMGEERSSVHDCR